MNWEAIGAVGESIGAFAVLITLVYLAIQMRQNTQAMKTSAVRSMQDLFHLTEHNERYIDYIMKSQRGETLTPEERAHMVERFFSVLRTIERLWHERELGALSEEYFTKNLDLLRWAMSHPSALLMWEQMADAFDPGFCALVDAQVLADDANTSCMTKAFLALDTPPVKGGA